MRQVLLMCAGGMSSSLMAKKVTACLQDQGKEIVVTACGAGTGKTELRQAAAYDLYLVSPQIRFQYEEIKGLADQAGKPLVQVEGANYVPIPKAIAALAERIGQHLPE